ncbi:MULTISPECIES: acetyl-CoA carboxylase biotin carboxyl carrier protein subunit [unclassified Streptomyces]|uniref:acetyl-CoA carboxylase biotin carboxyl carrier protein n=1 Tax=unclassified Streptomyces TaxID=2593676 RepID=UPI002DDBA0AE|nr:MULTISPECIES: acetyl-CoA carboxylase biotin carboxyl carrier protein subunit [unclassified Streptomyces]WSC43656.1 biotin/lipoyl-binding protein [Streptomyces sp. NBC_01762]WSD23192.1 biotin/lipoyl-binding protein [Streptomyces sp. NBC_01751]WSJ54751.1 biotin/lipoyl-binding protein [Streptomyces sp. NBC_01318]
MTLQHADVRRILQLLDSAEHLESLEIRIGEFVLQARKPGAAPLEALTIAPPVHAPGPLADRTSSTGPSTASPEPAASAGEQAAEIPVGMTAIRAPMPGTFYRTPAPDQPPFVEEGEPITAGTTMCLVEVMKMFNSVAAPVTGRVHSILVEHGQAVSSDQILMIIAPDETEAAK